MDTVYLQYILLTVRTAQGTLPVCMKMTKLEIKLQAVYMQGTLKAAVYGILNCLYILQVHCIDGSIPSVYTAAY